jgi:hypothetical protein
MRDFRDAKSMAQTIRAGLAAKGLKITISESLELIAKALGAADWNTLSAAIKAAGPPPKPRPAAAAPSNDSQALDDLAQVLGQGDWSTMVAALWAPPPSPPSAPIPPPSAALQATLRRAAGAAAARRHEYTTLDHLLLALLDDADAAAVLSACQVDLGFLRDAVTRYLDEELKPLELKAEPGGRPGTAGLHRVIQRAVSHVQSARRDVVTGANLLTAIFSEEESHAASLLGQQGMTRADAVNFIARGIRRGGRAA